MRRTGRPTAMVAFWCVLLAAGCSGSDPAPTSAPGTAATAPPTSTSIPDPVTTTLPTTTTTTATASPATDTGMLDDLREWTTVLGPSPDLTPLSQYNGTWSVATDERMVMSVRSPDTDEVVIHTSPGIDWLIEGPLLSGDWLAFVDWESGAGDYQLWARNLATGSEELIEEWGGTPAIHNIPQLAIDGGWLAWSTSVDEATSCIRVRDLQAGETRDIDCVAAPDNVVWQPILDMPYLTYRHQGEDPVCFALLVVELPDGSPVPVPHKECWGYDGTQDGEVRVWTEFEPDSGGVLEAPLFAEHDGVVWSLGPVSVGSTTLCEGRAFWKVELGSFSEIRTWAAGEPVRVVYRSTLATLPTTLPWCMDGWVSFMFADVEAAPLTRQVVALRVDTLAG